MVMMMMLVLLDVDFPCEQRVGGLVGGGVVVCGSCSATGVVVSVAMCGCCVTVVGAEVGVEGAQMCVVAVGG
ncbi:uncharacterized protein ACLA_092710 [Aspergillus clavatus NRRL 1]|uniref:Secreted protein n=1 Tax=Aspergillus clavatus (strain ATCC 1007 / CBS 513.65 / DSM 816 / NCTC 3887 / NRRL 1 / QM 1276 / 107) TaxID=344612 RepID=A1CFC4_ASPCL|nr:uncharacterized protein ACLA_092710 [Aspergillus clavatus NRRL 1]EAW11573.1 hypothetical protein ACLA_092710 [Aspergillus clavatus NRRL 1]